ncbi:MAG: CHRD domain-containing protein [Rhodocyclaceae bacterium]|nr:CHRD domain-containing protein [Rhodocyclaceae bacterium]
MHHAFPTPQRRSSLAAIVLLTLSCGLQAQQPVPVALKGSAEVPPVITSASGAGLFTVMLDGTISGTIKIAGFVPTAAHIHEAPIDKNGPVIITLTQTSSETFAVPDAARLNSSQFKRYQAGLLYVNVRSAAYPSGEVRAQLRPLEKMAMPLQPGF